MAPPVCVVCESILSGDIYLSTKGAICGTCGPRLQATEGRRWAIRALQVVGGALGVAIGGYLATGSRLCFLALGAIWFVWEVRPAPVVGPKPMGNAMPPPGSGRV